MSGIIRRRRVWKRLLVATGVAVAAAATAGSLAAALQVREVQVAGTLRFPAEQVADALRPVIGSPTVATRVEDLRLEVLLLPWVADAVVRISLDGIVTCVVTEHIPVAVAVDGPAPVLLDSQGRTLGPDSAAGGLLRVSGYLGQSEDLMELLRHRGALESGWGAPLTRVERLGPRNARLSFADVSSVVVADPTRPEDLATARRVLAAWLAEGERPPISLDTRAKGRVAVRPDPTPPADAGREV